MTYSVKEIFYTLQGEGTHQPQSPMSPASFASLGLHPDLLRILALHPGRVLSRDFLLDATRGREAAPFDRTIDVQVGRLRRKLGAELIQNVRGVGYIVMP